MDSGLAIMIIGGAIASILLQFLIIAWAVKPDRRDGRLAIQNDLLIAIAMKQGATLEEINEILSRH